MSLISRFPNRGPRHWHITRDIKPRGECAACDDYWRMHDVTDDEIPSSVPPDAIKRPD